MKKFLKSIFSFFAITCLAVCCAFTFTACKDKVSNTTVSTDKVSFNGGIASIYNGYLYFINGTKTNDGTGLTGNTRSAICRTKIDEQTGELNEKSEVVVGDLVGFEDGSLYFFGDFMYYATPNSGRNSNGDVLYNETRFMRYDLVNKKSHIIYTTAKNDSSEQVNYAYYITDDTLNLLIFESSAATLTSLKIDTEPSQNFKIESVKSAIFSQTFGKAENGAASDANNFVFFTKDSGRTFQGGAPAVYMIAPDAEEEDEKICLSDEGLEISLETIKSGKLIYSLDTIIYCTSIDAATTSISKDSSTEISHVTYENIIYIDDEDGSMSIVYCDEGEVFWAKWEGGVKLKSQQISSLDSTDDLSFIAFETIEEDVPYDDSLGGTAEEEPNGDGEGTEAETYKQKFKYLFFTAGKKLYKLEVMHEVLKEDFTQNTDPIFEVSDELTYTIQLTKMDIESPNGCLIPKIIGKYIYFFAKEYDEKDKVTDKVGLHRADITVRDNVDENAEYVGKGD